MNFAALSKDLLSTNKLLFCSVFLWLNMIICRVFFKISLAPPYRLIHLKENESGKFSLELPVVSIGSS